MCRAAELFTVARPRLTLRNQNVCRRVSECVVWERAADGGEGRSVVDSGGGGGGGGGK